jgi:transposase
VCAGIGPGGPAWRKVGYGTASAVQLGIQTAGGPGLSGSADGSGAQANLSRNLLSQWVRKYEIGGLTDEVVDAVRIAEYEGKIAELECKVGQLTMEIDLPQKGPQLARRPNVESYSIVSGPQVAPSHADVER